MRYFNFVLKGNTQYIREHTKKINLRDYDYDRSLKAMNIYMSMNLKNGLCYFAYNEEGDSLYAAFAYDEKQGTFCDAYGYIFGMLNDIFGIKKVKEEPCEITMYRFHECLSEGRRRDCGVHRVRLADIANMDAFDDYLVGRISLRYALEEKIISEEHKKVNPMYHESVIKELSNIESHKNISEAKGNMVHYVVSGRSVEAASDITETLMQRLAAAGRISGRRMEIIREIDPELYKSSNSHLEEFIGNNYGGVIVLDLSEKFGHDSSEYTMTCQYLEKIVKKYKNDCLFVFTYNTDMPGFAYQFLPLIQKYVIPVTLKEGEGDRKAAVTYMKELIRNSDYKQYVRQAGEFMKLFPGDKFSQTDVLMAFEQFEPWCLNKNVFQAYDYNFSDTVMLDRDENTVSSYKKLQKMIGLFKVKEQIEHIIATDLAEKERKKILGSDYELGTMHMVFGGNPGTAKTTVAKLFAGIAKEKGILKSGAFVEVGGMDLGCSNIRDKFVQAKGGVLFIDEAYSMANNVAIAMLIQEMENRRDDVIVILAGYNESMKFFMERNEGLKSRIPFWIDFPDYTLDELTDIFGMMVKDRGFTITEDAVKEARMIFEKARYMDNFGNGRYVRNLLDRAVQNQSVRLLAGKENAEDIKKKELFLLKKEDVVMPEDGPEGSIKHDGKCSGRSDRKSGTARKELEEMIGLSSVKEIINKMIARFKLKKAYMDKGLCDKRPSMHMVFTGNPGTAKTTVARLFAEIMKDEKVLPSGHFVEAGRGDLVGRYVGHTAPLVQKKFKEAQGGVLFIDEAYSLCDGHENSFGDEAINTIVQEMENHRDDVIVIFAGYPDRMKEFLDRNPGMSSRIAFHVDFEDYSVQELCDMTKLMLSEDKRTITDAAMEKLRKIYESVCGTKDYGNGRFVRKILEEAGMNLAERLSELQLDESEMSVELLTTIEEQDIPEPDILDPKKEGKKKQFGFCCT